MSPPQYTGKMAKMELTQKNIMFQHSTIVDQANRGSDDVQLSMFCNVVKQSTKLIV